MSRSSTYCVICDAKHRNGGLGRCDKHIGTMTPAEQAAAEQREAKASEFALFMNRNEDERWDLVFDFLYEQGFRT